MLQFCSPTEAASWLRAHVSASLHSDSRLVRPGDGFVAWPGAAVDGRQFVRAALEQGASACLVEGDGVEAFGFDDARVATYTRLKAATGEVASLFFGNPSRHLAVVAVTGTNGKTSTAWWLAQALSGLEGAAAIPCGLVGTLGVGRPPHLRTTGMTTPDPVLLQRQFRQFVDEGMQACAIEASSIGLAERRLDGTRIQVAVFTNFTHDHLDYHGSMDAYWRAKAELFSWPGLKAAVLNLDDPMAPELVSLLSRQSVETWTCSMRGEARLRASDVHYSGSGLTFTVTEGDASLVLQTRLVGEFNVANLLGVIGAMRAIGVPLARAVAACRVLEPVPGRMECLTQPGRPLVAVDYAHTPDALSQALVSLRPLASERGGKLWCVFGCGGDRDAAKRPLMGRIAQQQADHVVLTSDNPRSEDPMDIIQAIRSGQSPDDRIRAEPDRFLAIDFALTHAGPFDVVLIAGKGHEDYQEAAGIRQPFSDRDCAMRILRRLNGVIAPVDGGRA